MCEEQADKVLEAAGEGQGLHVPLQPERFSDGESAEELEGGNVGRGDPAQVDLVARRHEDPLVVVTPRDGRHWVLEKRDINLIF